MRDFTTDYSAIAQQEHGKYRQIRDEDEYSHVAGQAERIRELLGDEKLKQIARYRADKWERAADKWDSVIQRRYYLRRSEQWREYAG